MAAPECAAQTSLGGMDFDRPLADLARNELSGATGRRIWNRSNAFKGPAWLTKARRLIAGMGFWFSISGVVRASFSAKECATLSG